MQPAPQVWLHTKGASACTCMSSMPFSPMLKESILMSRLMGLLLSTPVTVLDGPAASRLAALGLTLSAPTPLARLASLCG